MPITLLIIPEFCLLECTNVIWKQARFSGMSNYDAQILLNDLKLLKLKRVPTKHILNYTLNIGMKYNLAIYDSSYIALAHHYQYPLITLDIKQEQIARQDGITIVPITNFR